MPHLRQDMHSNDRLGFTIHDTACRYGDAVR